MSRAKLLLEIEGGEEQAGVRVFHPGDVISGQIAIEPDEDIPCRDVTVWVGWHTEGKGDQDRGVAGSQKIEHKEVLRRRSLLADRFSFQLPAQPWSYSGHLINIVWAVELKIDVPMRKDVSTRVTFALLPR